MCAFESLKREIRTSTRLPQNSRSSLTPLSRCQRKCGDRASSTNELCALEMRIKARNEAKGPERIAGKVEMLNGVVGVVGILQAEIPGFGNYFPD